MFKVWVFSKRLAGHLLDATEQLEAILQISVLGVWATSKIILDGFWFFCEYSEYSIISAIFKLQGQCS